MGSRHNLPRRPPSSRLHARCPLRRSHACAPVEDAAAARRVCAQAIDALRMTHRSRRCRRVLLCPRARSRALAGGGAPSSAGCPLGDRVRDACARAQARVASAGITAPPCTPDRDLQVWRQGGPAALAAEAAGGTRASTPARQLASARRTRLRTCRCKARGFACTRSHTVRVAATSRLFDMNSCMCFPVAMYDLLVNYD